MYWKNYHQKWKAVGYASSSGYVDSDLFLKWLEHFVQYTRPSADSPRVIILDGHHNHKTLAAVEFCRAHGIHLITFPSHSTHKIHPLDRTYFKALKSEFNNVTDSFMVTHPGQCITVYEMARLSGTAYIRTSLPEKAVYRFKACGIWPFDTGVFTEKYFAAVIPREQATSQEYPNETSTNESVTSQSYEGANQPNIDLRFCATVV